MTAIKKDMVASFRYIMKNGREEILENTIESMPTSYLHGSDGIQPYLQHQLEGLVPGEKKKLFLSKTSGLTEDDFTFDVVIDEVRDALPEELILGYPVQLATEKCEADCECYNLRNDLAKLGRSSI